MSLLLAACVRGGSASHKNGIWYTVLGGDTLSSLSRRSGLSVEAISDANSLTSEDLPRLTGRRLWLPGVAELGPDVTTRPLYTPKPKPTTATRPVDEPLADGRYEIVPRSAWTSEPVGSKINLMGKVMYITVHHTDEHSGMEGLSDLEVIRRIENYHRGPEKRWAAIGYHYLVGKDGKIYEGRPVKYQGAHVSTKNENNLGISVIGDFQYHLPNAKQLAALKAFLDDERARFGVPINEVEGHRERRPTICPGDALMAWIRSYRSSGSGASPLRP